MWWTDEESWVGERITRLLGAWRENELPSVTAIGSTWTESGERTLFVGIAPSFDPRPLAWAPTSTPIDRFSRALIRRYGPLGFPVPQPPPRADPGGGVAIAASRTGVVGALANLARIYLGLQRADLNLVLVPLALADELTRTMLEPFELPSTTKIGYVGPIRPLTGKAESIFRRGTRKRATAGCLIRSQRGTFLTTAGHLGASKGEKVYRRVRHLGFYRRWLPWGDVAAVTSPEHPDTASTNANGLDIAAVATEDSLNSEGWRRVEIGDPRTLRRRNYIRWNGAVTGPHEGWLAVTANMAESEGDDVPYEHALMVIGNPPHLGGRDGDSGSAVYDADGLLLGHLVGTEGARRRSTAPTMWFQMIDIAQPYLSERCGHILEYRGEPGH
jgi:hypothetical protein